MADYTQNDAYDFSMFEDREDELSRMQFAKEQAAALREKKRAADQAAAERARWAARQAAQRAAFEVLDSVPYKTTEPKKRRTVRPANDPQIHEVPPIQRPQQAEPDRAETVQQPEKNRPVRFLRIRQMLASDTARPKMSTRLLCGTVACVLVVSLAAALLLRQRITLDRLNSDILQTKEDIDNETNDGIRLKSEIYAKFPQNSVIDYAENTLGMVRLNDYNLIPVQIPGENEVQFAGGRAIGSAALAASDEEPDTADAPASEAPNAVTSVG